MDDVAHGVGMSPRAGGKRMAGHVTGLVVVVLLLLRVAVALVSLTLDPNLAWLVSAAASTGMYVALGGLIARESGRLDHFYQDRISIGIFALSGPYLALTSPGIGLCGLTLVGYSAAAVVLIRSFKSGRARLAPVGVEHLKWLLRGLLSGGSLAIVMAIARIALGEHALVVDSAPLGVRIASVLGTFLSRLSYASALEEPLYRGFLLGLLRSKGVRPLGLVVCQALLFWIAHLNYLTTPFTFWIAVPAAALLLGWLTVRSGSVASGMMAHAIYNAMGFTALLIASSLLR